jgi:hypothetical protein
MDDSFLIIESPPDAYIDDLGGDFKHPDAARGSTHTGKLPSENPFNAIRDILMAPRDPSGTYVPKGPTHTGAFPGHSGEKSLPHQKNTYIRTQARGPTHEDISVQKSL